MKSKKYIFTIFKIVVQIAAFLVLPGLFAQAFVSIGQIVGAITTGSLSWTNVSGSVWTLIAVIPSAIIFGRVFCGSFCSFGAMQDLLHFIGSKIGLTKAVSKKMNSEAGRKADKVLKYAKYLVLVFIAAFIWTGVVKYDTETPWTVFGQYTKLGFWPGLAPLLTLGGALLIIIIIGSVLFERGFCRYFCPMGGVFSLVSHISIFGVKKDKSVCKGCSICTKNCKMGINLTDKENANSMECVHCQRCAVNCPKGNIKAKAVWMPYVEVIITAAIIAFSMFMINRQISEMNASNAAMSIEETSQISTGAQANEETGENDMESVKKGPYTDGVYTGSGRGYRGDTTVTITVENGYITKIVLDDFNDDGTYMTRAKEGIIPQVLDKQTTEVDAVTGATKSCNGIISAINEALGIEAEKEDPLERWNAVKDKVTTEDEGIEKESDSKNPEKVDLSGIEDGEYDGAADAFRGELSVRVTVKDHKIEEIAIVSYYDHEEYLFLCAPIVIDEILSTQSLNVDAVSGATYSSNGIIKAVANSLGIPEDKLLLTEGRELAELHGKHGHVVQKFIESKEQYDELVEKYALKE